MTHAGRIRDILTFISLLAYPQLSGMRSFRQGEFARIWLALNIIGFVTLWQMTLVATCGFEMVGVNKLGFS